MIQKSILLLLLLLVGCGCISQMLPTGNELTEEQLHTIIIPQVKAYCENINQNAFENACPTCKENILGQPAFQMTVSETGDHYLVQVKQQTIYNRRNDNPGEADLNFLISKKGDIINSQFPPLACRDGFRQLNFSSVSRYLENCRGYSEIPVPERTGEYAFCAYEISDENLAKLKLLDEVYGKEICTFDYAEALPTSEQDCRNTFFKTDAETIWFFEYQSISARLSHNSIRLQKNNGKYYLVVLYDQGGRPDNGITYELFGFDPSNEEKLRG